MLVVAVVAVVAIPQLLAALVVVEALAPRSVASAVGQARPGRALQVVTDTTRLEGLPVAVVAVVAQAQWVARVHLPQRVPVARERRV
jgi:hypothetical protein